MVKKVAKTAGKDPVTASSRAGARIRFKDQYGRIQSLTEVDFYNKFGVKYTAFLRHPKVLSPTFLRGCIAYADHAKNTINGQRLKFYKGHLRFANGFPAYIAEVNKTVGYGIFAGRDLRPTEILGEFTGVLTQNWSPLLKKPSDFNPYLLKYPFDSVYAIDATKYGNELRFLNHSAKDANVKPIYLLREGFLHIFFQAQKKIPRNRQLLLDYGNDYWRGNAPQEIAA